MAKKSKKIKVYVVKYLFCAPKKDEQIIAEIPRVKSKVLERIK